MTDNVTRSLEQWLDYISSVHPKDIDMGLARFSEVAARLGVLQPAPRVVTIAGTNGKGSTTVALEALLIDAGLKVGATLSPHMNRFNERVRLHGIEVDDSALCRAFGAADAARAEIPLTYFEYSALVALYLFSRADLDVVILEIGLGGRLDAFNAVDADLAIVTSIGLDHQDYLGSDLETIGVEKAGIFRPDQDVVLGQVTRSVHVRAAQLNCRTFSLDEDVRVVRRGRTWSYYCDRLDLSLEDIPLGALAPANCALALTAANLLIHQPTRDASVLAAIRLPGRMERYQHEEIDVVLDVAHNPAAAAFLARELNERFPDRRYVAVLGALEGKDVAGMMRALGPLVRHWLLIPTVGWRGQSAAAVAAAWRGQNPVVQPIEIIEDAASALPRAVSLTGREDAILAFGSFSAVEQVRKLCNAPHSAIG